jgi:hypothetical protein
MEDMGSGGQRLRPEENVGVPQLGRKEDDEEEQKPKIWSLADTAVHKGAGDMMGGVGGVMDPNCRNVPSHTIPTSLGWGSQMGMSMGMGMGMNMGMNMGMGLPLQGDLGNSSGHDPNVSGDCASSCYQFRHPSPGDLTGGAPLLYGKYSSLFGSIPTTCQSYSSFMSRSSPSSCVSQPGDPSMSSPYLPPAAQLPPAPLAASEPPTDTPPDTPPALKQRGNSMQQQYYRPNGVPDSYPPPGDLLHSMSMNKPMVDNSPDKNLQTLGQNPSVHPQHMQNPGYNQIAPNMVPASSVSDPLTAFRPVFKG